MRFPYRVALFDWRGFGEIAGRRAAASGSLQQPFFRRLEIRKSLDIYTSIPRHQYSKLSWVNLLWSADKRDFYSAARENQQPFCREESVRKRDFKVESGSVDEKFIVLRALAMFSD
jgi:hypothetical protein